MNDKYQNDPVYRRLVDTLESLIHQNELTPSEIREAAVLASINYEMKKVRTIYIDKETEEAFLILRKKTESRESE
jgi:hypothetical protein